MKSTIVLLITSAITATFASKLVSVPFTAVDLKGTTATSYGRKKLGTLIDVPIENIDLAYLIDVQIGTPPQPFTLLLDTGSSSTWVPLDGCGRFCGFPKHSLQPKNSSTFVSAEMLFSIRYGEGFARGMYAQDTLLVNGVSIPDVNFAVSNLNDGELTTNGADGILGIGPDSLSTYNNPAKKVIPTFVTTMFQKGIIDHNVFSVYFRPVSHTSKQQRINGEIVFGGVEEKHYTGDINYVPVTNSNIFRDYWALDMDSITVGNFTKTYEKKLSTMVDTGSTLVFLPGEVITQVFKNVKGMHKDLIGQYVVPCESEDLPDIVFTMNGYNFTLKPEHYVIKSGSLLLSKDTCYTYLHESPSFVDAILGYAFLQQYVSVYDNENRRIGLAERSKA